MTPRVLLAALSGVLPLTLVAGTLPVSADTAPTLVVNGGRPVQPGQAVEVELTGLSSNAGVMVTAVEPVLFTEEGTFYGSGSVSQTMHIAAEAEPGEYLFQAHGSDDAGDVSASTRVRIVEATPPEGAVALEGSVREKKIWTDRKGRYLPGLHWTLSGLPGGRGTVHSHVFVFPRTKVSASGARDYSAMSPGLPIGDYTLPVTVRTENRVGFGRIRFSIVPPTSAPFVSLRDPGDPARRLEKVRPGQKVGVVVEGDTLGFRGGEATSPAFTGGKVRIGARTSKGEVTGFGTDYGWAVTTIGKKAEGGPAKVAGTLTSRDGDITDQGYGSFAVDAPRPKPKPKRPKVLMTLKAKKGKKGTSYTYTVANRGDGNAYSVYVGDILPRKQKPYGAGARYVKKGVFKKVFGTLKPGKVLTVTLKVKGKPAKNDATVHWKGGKTHVWFR